MPASRFDRKSGPSPAYPDNGQHANVRLEKISVEQNTNETLEWLRPVNPEQMGTAAESRTEHISQREPELSAPVCTLWNVAQVALIRFLISVVSRCWKVTIWPKYFVLSPFVSISTSMSSISIFSGVRALVAENFRLSWVDPESSFFSTPLEFAYHVLELFF